MPDKSTALRPSWRAALAPALVVALTTVLLAALVQWLLVDELARSTQLRIEHRAAMLALQLQASLRGSVQEVRLLARSPLLRPGGDVAAIVDELEFQRTQSPQFMWLGLVAPDGQVVAGTQRWLEGRSIAERPVFLHGRAGTWLGDAHPAVALEPLMREGGTAPQDLLEIAEPVRDAQGRIVGVLAAHLGTGWIEPMRRAALGQEGGGPVGLSVHLLTDPAGRSVLPDVPPPGLAAWRPGGPVGAVADNGHAYFAAAAELGGQLPVRLPWRVLVLQSEEEALAPARHALRLVLLLGGGATLLVGALGLLMARRLIRPWGPLFDTVLARRGRDVDAGTLADDIAAASRGLAGTGHQPSEPETLLARLASGAQLLRRVVDHLPVGVALIDRHFRVEYLNPAYTRLLGWTTEQVRGRIAAEFLFDAVEREAFLRIFDQGGQRPGEVASRFEALTNDGRRVAVQWQLVPMSGPDGQAEGAIAVVSDIRPERQARARGDAMAGRLRALADAAVNDALATLDGEGRVLEWSRGAETLSGHAAPAAIGRALAELLPPASGAADEAAQDDVVAWLLQARRDGLCAVASERRVADGRVRWFEGSVYPLGLAPGQARFGLLLRDLSDRREADRALQRSEERLRLALDAARMGTWEAELDPDLPTITWSEGYGQLLGLPTTPGGVPTAQMHALVHPEDWPAVRDAMVRTMKAGEPLSAEFRIRHEQGWCWHALHGRAVMDAEGRALRILGVGMDITRRREAERAQADSEARLAAVVASASDAIISTDVAGCISLFNPAAERIFGHPVEAMLGQTLAPLLPPAAQAGHAAQLGVFAGSGVTRRAMGAGRVAGRHADGRLLQLEASISQALVNGQLVLTAILRDVTERAAQEAALETTRAELAQLNRRLLDQEKTTTRRLAQALHDELGQTLTALRLHWEALQSAAPEQLPRQRARVEALVVAANRQIRSVLHELRPPLLDELGLAAALDNELQQQRPLDGRPTLTLQVPARLQGHRWPPDVEYAAFMIGREALVNALHHAQAGAVTLSLDGDAGQLELAVHDDGVGFADAARAGVPGHLGLVGMRERALAIGGALLVDSGPGRGTRITLQWTLLE